MTLKSRKALGGVDVNGATHMYDMITIRFAFA